MSCRSYNRHKHNAPRDAVYVGRPTKWGNPYSHLVGAGLIHVASRGEAIRRYEEWLRSKPALLAAAKRELRGKDLVCWCAPLACHADVLIRVANEEDE